MFDDQPVLTGETLRLRPLAADDLEPLFAVASDPAIWAGHPVKNRHERGVFAPYFAFLLQAGGALVIQDRASGDLIGCSRYYPCPDAPEDIGIGFTFLAASHWGGGVNFALKRLMLDHAFAKFERVWFHIDPSNIRSQKATGKLGAVHMGDAVIDLSGSAANWMRFRLDRDVWRRAVAARVGGA